MQGKVALEAINYITVESQSRYVWFPGIVRFFIGFFGKEHVVASGEPKVEVSLGPELFLRLLSPL